MPPNVRAPKLRERPAQSRSSAPRRGATGAPDAHDVIYGLQAGLAICKARPADVRHVYFDRSLPPDMQRHIATVAGARAQGVSAREIESVARSPFHEGLCVEAHPRGYIGLSDLAARIKTRKGLGIALDRVRNSYNVGAIVRTAAFFGVDALLLGAPSPHPGLDPNAVRVAEGGAEHLAIGRTTDLAESLSRLHGFGIRILGADAGAEASTLARATTLLPTLLVMGNEREGLGPRVRAACDGFVAIRGGGAIESLNVGVAAGVLLDRLRGPGDE